jgi:ABC-type glycerol-3-phosphate transport system permease component
MKKLCIVLAFALPMVFQFCSSSKKSQSAIATPKITYMAKVQPAIAGNCSPCHIPPKGFKKAFDNYDSVRSNIDEIIARIQKQPDEKGFMPFKHPRLADSTIMVFVNWKKDGLAEK